MYRAMIVDDELWIVRGLERMLDWNTYGFELVGTSTDSEETLRLTEERKPDLLVSDIRMAGLNGIELMQKTKEKHRHMKYIMISGYSDFHYAREALRHGALDYILKPITKEALSDALLKAKEELDAEQLHTRQTLPDLEAVLYFLKSVGEAAHSDVTLNTLGLSGSYPNFRCIMYSHTERHDTWQAALCAEGESDAVTFISGQNRYMAVLNCTAAAEENILKQLQSMAQKTGQRVGISSRADTVDKVIELMEQARQAYYHLFIDPHEPYCEYREEGLSPLSLLMEEFEPLLKGDTWHVRRVHDLIEQLPEFTAKHRLTMKSLTLIYNYVISSINKTLITGSLPDHKLLLSVDAVRLAEDFGSMERFHLYLHEYVNRLSGHLDESAHVSQDATAPSNKSLITRVKQYIDQHYKSNVSLGELAERFHLDERYLSQLFKLETGQTFTSYLIGLRLNHARALLRNTSLSIQVISELCGYQDYFYFNKLFKKYVGTTPASYRKSAAK